MDRRDFLKASLAGTVPLATVGCARNTEADNTAGDPIDALSSMVPELPPIPTSEYADRVEKLRRLMADQGASAFFVESGPSLQYFTGVSWWRSERTFGYLLTSRGPGVFICPAFEEERAREQIVVGTDEVRIWQEHESPFAILGKVLQEQGLRTGKVALEPSTRHFMAVGFRKDSPGFEVVDGQGLIDACRMVKSSLELEYMELADRVTKAAYAAALSGLQPGMLESELADRISKAHAKLGARGGAMVLFGPNSALPHGSRNRRELAAGDVVLMDGGCSVQGYRSDVTRSVVFGQATQEQSDLWDTVYEAQSAVLAAAGPGVECQAVDAAAREVMGAAGFGSGYENFTHRLGHGIGLEGHEAPYMVKGNTLRLEPGMTFTNEPGLYFPGKWGIRHEDVVVVTEQGVRVFGERSTLRQI